ncbi:unnamed protein product [Absidia cylindrospora]
MAKEDAKQPSRRLDKDISKQVSSSRPRSTSLDSNRTSHFGSSHTLVVAARDKAVDLANSARDWLKPDWMGPMAHFDSLTTVMFSPLAGHPVYRSESMVKALQLAQQQQRHRQQTTSGTTTATSPTSPNNIKSRSDRNSTASELVLHRDSSSSTYPWPSSSVLLKADIPEPTSSLSLFQGFATTYPSLTSKSTSPHKKSRHRRKKQQPTPLDAKELADKPGSLKRIYVERERRLRESDNLEMQMTSIGNEIQQIDMQIDELINKRKALETKWTKLEGKEQQVQLKIEDLTEKILDEAQDHGSVDGTRRSRHYHSEDESDGEYEFGECFKSLRGHEGGILCVDFDHSKGTLISSSLDDTVRVWDLRHGRCSGQLEGHANLVRCLQLDDMRLLTGSDDGTIKQWDISCFSSAPTPATTDSFSDISSPQRSPSMSPNLNDDTASSRTVSYVSSFDDHQREVTAIDADSTNMVSGSNDKTMKLWDLETQKCVLTMDVMWASQNSSSNSSSSWSFDNFKMNFFESSIDYIGALQFWNFALASGTVDGKLRMWDLRTGQVHRTLPGHNGAITALQFDDIHLVSGSADKTIRVRLLDIQMGAWCTLFY